MLFERNCTTEGDDRDCSVKEAVNVRDGDTSGRLQIVGLGNTEHESPREAEYIPWLLEA